MAEGASTIVIVGATGDLAQRKLMPALFNLRCKGRLPEGWRILGFALEPYSDGEFRDFMWRGMQEFGHLAVRTDQWGQFVKNLFYVGGDLSIPQDLSRLGQRLKELEAGQQPANRDRGRHQQPHMVHPRARWTDRAIGPRQPASKRLLSVATSRPDSHRDHGRQRWRYLGARLEAVPRLSSHNIQLLGWFHSRLWRTILQHTE